MRLRTFTAPDMPAAMRMVREALGDDAIILATEKSNGGKHISVTAAIDTQDELPAPPPPRTERKPAPAPPPVSHHHDPTIANLRFEIQNILRFHNLPEIYIARMVQQAGDKDLIASIAMHRIGGNADESKLYLLALEKILGECLSFKQLHPERSHARTMLVGPPGVGKTLTIAKLASRLALEKKRFAVITTDTKRAGGVEQLQAFTDILGTELKVASGAKELAAQMKAIPKNTPVLVDTAGCNLYGDRDIREMTELASVEGMHPVLVLPAGGDSEEAIDMVEALSELPIEQLLVTRADTARRFGSVLAVALSRKLAFCQLSCSPSVVDPLLPVDPALLAQLLLRYQLQSR